jgi:predicted Zn-ribbon and HTH transcriptional regulator
MADLIGSVVYGVGLRPSACWDCGFEFNRGHRCLSLVQCLCCQVKVSARGRSLVKRSPTDCGVCLSVVK